MTIKIEDDFREKVEFILAEYGVLTRKNAVERLMQEIELGKESAKADRWYDIDELWSKLGI